MPLQDPSRTSPPGRRGLAHGLALALLVAIPFWAAVGLALVVAYQADPITQWQSALLVGAAIVELLLLRYVLRAPGALAGGLGQFAGRSAAVVFRRRPDALVRHTVMLSALAIAYLQFYFWDVYLQIESLNAVTVFIPVARVG